MADNPLYHFELRSATGVDHAGNLEPLVDIGLSIPVPQLSSGGTVLETASHNVKIAPGERLSREKRARILPNTRILETDDVRIAMGLEATGLFDRIDAPTKTKIGEGEKETRAHVAALKEAADQVARGNDPAPDATDRPVPASDDEGFAVPVATTEEVAR